MHSDLLIEHDHIQKTLNLLEIQFLDLCRDRAPDYAIMLSIVVYIQEYPEQAHHPVEDAIYSILLNRVSDEAGLIQEIVTDHTELEVISRNLRSSIELFKNGKGSMQELEQQLSEFLTRQRRHLYVEEMKVYPLMKRVLTARDWKDVQAMAPRMSDPVFGERTQNDYELLYRAIGDRFK
jgi:hemerythrin-like domain-containing protein